MSPEERKQLADAQAALVEALAWKAEAPEGFNADHVARAAASLLAKRRRAVEISWPGLAISLGDGFRDIFGEYARSQVLPVEGHLDGCFFARYLRRHGLLTDEGRLELMLAEMGRFRPIGAAFLRRRREFVLAFSTLRGAYWVTFRLPPWRRANFSQPLSPASK